MEAGLVEGFKTMTLTVCPLAFATTRHADFPVAETKERENDRSNRRAIRHDVQNAMIMEALRFKEMIPQMSIPAC